MLKTAQITLLPLPVFWERLLEAFTFFRAVIEGWVFGKCFLVSTLTFNSRALKALYKSNSVSMLLARLFLHLAIFTSQQPSVTSLHIRHLNFFSYTFKTCNLLLISYYIKCQGIAICQVNMFYGISVEISQGTQVDNFPPFLSHAVLFQQIAGWTIARS